MPSGTNLHGDRLGSNLWDLDTMYVPQLLVRSLQGGGGPSGETGFTGDITDTTWKNRREVYMKLCVKV